MINALRHTGIGLVAALSLNGVLSGCDKSESSVDCASELDEITFSVQAGAVQPDGSVTIYGGIELGDADAGSELTVRAVYVANQPVAVSPTDFNFRTWSISLTRDVLTATANGSPQASIPVVAYLYGGCVAHLPAAQEPVVTVPATDGGASDGSTDGGIDGSGVTGVDGGGE